MAGDGDVEMTEEQKSKLDDLIEMLDRGKTMHTLNSKEAEVLYKKVVEDGKSGISLLFARWADADSCVRRKRWGGAEQSQRAGHLQTRRAFR